MIVRRVVTNGAIDWQASQLDMVSWGRTRRQAIINFRREHPVWLVSEVLKRVRNAAREVGEGLAVTVTAAADSATEAFKRLGEAMSR